MFSFLPWNTIKNCRVVTLPLFYVSHYLLNKYWRFELAFITLFSSIVQNPVIWKMKMALSEPVSNADRCNVSRRGVHDTLIAAEWVMTFYKWAGLTACGRTQRPQTSWRGPRLRCTQNLSSTRLICPVTYIRFNFKVTQGEPPLRFYFYLYIKNIIRNIKKSVQ